MTTQETVKGKDWEEDIIGEPVSVKDNVIIPWTGAYYTKLHFTKVEEISELGFRVKTPEGMFWYKPSQVYKV